MNVFSSNDALAALAGALDLDPTPVEVEVEGLTLRTIRSGRDAVVSHALVDFLEPTSPTGAPGARCRYVPHVARRSVPAGEWPSVVRPEYEPAPYVDWSRFDDWNTYERHVAAGRSKLWPDARRCARKLTAEFGEVRYGTDDTDEIWDQCLSWKIDQYARTGAPNHFADPTAGRYLDAMRRAGLTTVASLHAGDRLVAAHIGLHHDGRTYYWLPAFDHEVRALSPGRILLHELLRTSHGRGDREFDFLVGDEPYKWYYATDARVVEPVGTPGPIARAKQLRTTLPRRYPALQRHGRRAVQWTRRRRAALTRARTPRS